MAQTKVSELNALAQRFKQLHQSGNPVILTNVQDAYSAELVASDQSCQAVATASWAIAATQGIEDNDMTLKQNIEGIRNVVKGIANAGKSSTIPVSCDMQNGYEDVRQTIQQAIALGCVGANIEDVDWAKGEPWSIEVAADRIRQAVQAAHEAGVPDFVINARTDVLGFGGTMHDVEERGTAYLAAGATVVFIWGVRVKDLTFDEVKRVCEKLDGRVSAQGPGPASLSMDELKGAGISRISFGPWIYKKSMQLFASEAGTLMSS